jgi:hypothetical protein
MYPSQLTLNPRRRLGDGWVRFIPWIVFVALILAIFTARERGVAALASPALLAAVTEASLIGGWVLGALYERGRG